MPAQRLSKIYLVGAAALYLAVVVLNNVTDYASNFHFVRHVLMMDSAFPDNAARWRAVDSPIAHHVGYVLIILWETAAAILCALGAMRLWRARHAAASFRAANGVATLGLTASLLLWFTGFLTIGGEWFLMWQSRTWNGQDAAFRLFVCYGLILIYLHLAEPEERSS